jgi:polyisoprenoid-binding protein YceI
VSFNNKQTYVWFACSAGLIVVNGRFEDVQGVAELDEKALHHSRVRATILSKSLTTGVVMLDRQLRGSGFFDASTHPTIVFKSSAVNAANASRTEIKGELTLRGLQDRSHLNLRSSRKNLRRSLAILSAKGQPRQIGSFAQLPTSAEAALA